MKSVLTKRLQDLKAAELKEIGTQFIPLKSALVDNDGERVALMGPLTDLDTGAWDTIDWFFRILHSRRMEGEPTFLFDIPIPIYKRATLHFEVV